MPLWEKELLLKNKNAKIKWIHLRILSTIVIRINKLIRQIFLIFLAAGSALLLSFISPPSTFHHLKKASPADLTLSIENNVESPVDIQSTFVFHGSSRGHGTFNTKLSVQIIFFAQKLLRGFVKHVLFKTFYTYNDHRADVDLPVTLLKLVI